MASLASLLSAIDPSRVQIDVYCRSHLGPCKSNLTNCNVLKERLFLSSVIRSRGFFMKCLSYAFQFLLRFAKICKFNLERYTYALGGRLIKANDYDAIIAYQESIARYVQYIKSTNKIAWVHCDYERLINERPEIIHQVNFEIYDKIVCVSKSAKASFLRVFPGLSSKVLHIYNIVDSVKIRDEEKSSPNCNADFVKEGKTIVSVGRFDEVKQFDKIPFIASKIKELTNVPFKWYIIGAGNNKDYEDVVQAKIKKFSVDDNVIIYPAQKHVYPYMMADVLVSTSKSETFSLVVFEARALGVLPLMNDIPIAYEIIRDAETGFISSLDKMPMILTNILENNIKLDFDDWDNSESIASFYNLY